MVLAMVHAIRKEHRGVLLRRIRVEEMVGILQKCPLEIYIYIDWSGEEIGEYIGRVLRDYARNYGKNGEKQFKSMLDGGRLLEYVRGISWSEGNYYNNRNVGIKPNDIWSWDGTWITVDGEKHLVIIIMDVGSRKVKGWRVVESENDEDIIACFDEALVNNEGIPPAVMHGDEGFSSRKVCSRLEEEGVKHSVNRKGEFGNNVQERLNGIIKNTVIPKLKGLGILKEGGINRVMEATVNYYNNERRHGLFNKTPEVNEMCLSGMDDELVNQ